MSDQEVREYVLRNLVVHIDNGPGALLNRAQRAARSAMSEVPGATLADYRAARSAGLGDRAYWPYVDAAGDAVCEVIREDLADTVPSGELWYTIVTALLDFGDKHLRAMLGDHYLPDADTVRGRDFPDDDA